MDVTEGKTLKFAGVKPVCEFKHTEPVKRVGPDGFHCTGLAILVVVNRTAWCRI